MHSRPFILDKKRWRIKFCPCGRSNRDGKFVPFIGYDDCGYCHSCGQTFYPDNENAKNKINLDTISYQSNTLIHSNYSTPPYEQLNATRGNYDKNNFIKFLLAHFDIATVQNLIVKYNIGSYPEISGSTVFWQIDQTGQIRGGKIMVYDPLTGRRIKQPYSKITWVHSHKKQSDYILNQCFFGEHLASLYPTKRIAVVESEKSAIIASIYFPQFNWVAAGGCHISFDKFNGLAGKDPILFPDANKYEEWTSIAKKYSNTVNASVSDYLEINTTKEEKEAGIDIADWLLNLTGIA